VGEIDLEEEWAGGASDGVKLGLEIGGGMGGYGGK